MLGLVKAALAVAILLAFGAAGWIVVADGGTQRIARFASTTLDRWHQQLMRIATRQHQAHSNSTKPGVPAAANTTNAPTPAERRAAGEQANREDAAWKAYFHPSPGCGAQAPADNLVECGNEYARARRTFEDERARLRKPASPP